ncbi:MAG: PhzF family phenazine biosynthesis protein [Candidatus Aminicenantes bacterium]|nr:PhzF family phenazine biosynthesis protein [Candidatus Aminicenantes bacterium]
MDNPVFYIVDVFAEDKYTGNQLAVFRNTEHLSEEEMLKIAQEMHFSETTFILSEEPHNGGFDVRIFTPAREVPFAGHPTLGTAYIIQSRIIKKPIDEVILNLQIGQIPVTFSYSGGEANLLRMKQKAPVFGHILDKEIIADALNLKKKDLDDRFPVEEVSTGLSFIIVPLKTLTGVKWARINRDKFYKIIDKLESKAVLIFSPETYSPENNLNARVFADYYNVPEDPATGSANGCLAGYLVKNRYFGKDSVDINVEQGYEIERPSLLRLQAEKTPDGIDVFVGGRVVPIAQGNWL